MIQCTECRMWYFTEWGIRGHLCLPEAREMMITPVKRENYYEWFDREFELKPI